MLKTKYRIPLYAGLIACLIAVAIFFALQRPEISLQNDGLEKKYGTGFLSIEGVAPDTAISVLLKFHNGEQVIINESENGSTAGIRVFDYVLNEHNYTITISFADKSVALDVFKLPMMIVSTLKGFSSKSGLDLYVGKNSISSWTPVDWSGHLKQTIPLPLKPSGPFCLIISEKDNASPPLKVCHKLPPDPYTEDRQ